MKANIHGDIASDGAELWCEAGSRLRYQAIIDNVTGRSRVASRWRWLRSIVGRMRWTSVVGHRRRMCVVTGRRGPTPTIRRLCRILLVNVTTRRLHRNSDLCYYSIGCIVRNGDMGHGPVIGLTALCMQNLLTCLKQDWINLG